MQIYIYIYLTLLLPPPARALAMADLASLFLALLLLLVFFLAPAVDDTGPADAKGSRPCCLVLLLAARWGVLCAGDLVSSSAVLLWPKMVEGSSAAAAAASAVLLLALFAAVDSGETRLAPPAVVLMGEDVAIAEPVDTLDVLVAVVVAASSTWSVPVKFLRVSWALLPLPVRPCRKEITLASSASVLLVMPDDEEDWSAGVRRKLTPLKVRVMDVLSSAAADDAGADGATPTAAVATSDILEGMTER